MSSITDPARELADLCGKLAEGKVGVAGADALAELFKVSVWSSEFFQIMFTISRRADELIVIVEDLELDADFKAEAVGHIRRVQQAFSHGGLNNHWSHALAAYLSPEHVQPIKMLSGMVRSVQSYAKLTDKEVSDLLVEIDTLLAWLNEHQLAEHDFIRQVLIDGLVQFRFRLERIGWVGWGYTLQSLRDVIGAYLALERGVPDPGLAPVADAILKKTMALLTTLYAKLHAAKGVAETGDFVLRMYGVAAIVHKSGIAGYLTAAAAHAK